MSNKKSLPDSDNDWSKTLAETVGAEVRRLRDEQRLSAVALSEITRELGHPITRGTIAKIEGNHRSAKLDVAELLVLAAALNVPPLLLLFPPYPDGHVQPLPDVTTTAYDATEWASGHAQMTGHPNVSYAPRPNRLVELADERARINAGFAQLLEKQNDRGWMDKVFDMIEQANQRRDEINKEVGELGGVVKNGEG